jgi:hypothetical protein
MTLGIQKLKGGAEVNIGTTPCKCRDCGAEIYWAVTKKKHKIMSVIFVDGGWQSHYIDCPDAQKFKQNVSPTE